MTRTRWFRPVLGLVLALAVGVAAALVAMRFAPPQQVPAEPAEVQTVLAPVLEPVTDAPDGEEELPSSDAVDGTFPISEPIGTARRTWATARSTRSSRPRRRPKTRACCRCTPTCWAGSTCRS